MYEEIIKPFLSEKRFKHSINVSKSAEQLAIKYGADPEKAKIAGMLHDIMKEMTPEEHKRLARELDVKLDEFELNTKKLLHAVIGSKYIEKVLGINDSDILNAVRYHTTGRAGMSVLEKVVFVADFISEDRDFKGVEELRKLAEKGLDDVLMAGLKDTIKMLADDEKPIHPNTFNAYNEMAFKVKNRKSKNPKFVLNKIYEVLDKKKAINVNTICIKDVSTLADYFIFAGGTSTTHVKALADEVKFRLKEEGILPNRKEDSSDYWILLDYGDVIVHIFTEETRKLYNLEGLWDNTRKIER